MSSLWHFVVPQYTGQKPQIFLTTGNLPVFVFVFTQASLVILESLGKLNRGHVIWPKAKDLNLIHNSDKNLSE